MANVFRYLLILLSAATIVRASQYEGLPVQAVHFEPAEQPLKAEDLASRTLLKAGERFRRQNAAETIDRLFETGRYTDISIDVEPTAEGLTVRVLTVPQIFIGHIEVIGDIGQSPGRAELNDATRLQLGEPLDAGLVQQAEQNLRTLLTKNGFYEHSVRVETTEQPDIQQRDFKFIVETGRRAKYQKPVIQGDTGLSEAAIIRATGWRWRIIHLWRRVTEQRTNKGIVGLQRKYQDEGWLMADISASAPKYIPETKRVQVDLDINAGPKVDVRTVEAEVSKRVLKRYVPIFQELTVDHDLLAEGAVNLRDYFRTQGYFDATVDFTQRQRDAHHLLIEYTVGRGTRYKLVHVEITGNQFFSDETLRERMFIQEAGRLRLRYGRFSQTFLERDRESIRNLYTANGFHDVRVTGRLQNNYKGRPNHVAVTLAVDEGPMWRVRKVTLAGAKHVDPDELTGKLSSITGQPYSEVNVGLDRDAILTRYQAEGYADAAFQWAATPDPATHEVDLVYQINEGSQQRVRDVVLTGIERTKLRLVNRQVSLFPGDPLSLVEMSRIQQRLYQLGLFARINMAVQNPRGATESKYVLYDFHEASRYRVALGAGAEFARIGGTTSDLSKPEGSAGISARLSADLTRLNFLGLGHSISVRGRISNLEQLASVNYLAPRFRNVEGRNITFTTQYQASRDVRTFSSRRQEASIQVSQQISRASSVLARFAFRRVSTSDVVIPRLLVPQLLQPVRIGMFSGNFVQDRRDNPLDTKRGIYNTVDFGVAANAFGSQRSFVRGLVRNATYHKVTPQVVFARETAVGVIVPFHVPKGVSNSDAIPLPERFYGGGSSTHRGFPHNQAGPRDAGANGDSSQATGFPLGGNASLFNRLELRFPLLGSNIGGVLFHDAGNIYDLPRNISFRVRQRSDSDFNYMVHAVGFGIRYKTPVGPVRVDLAYSINPPRYRGFEGSIRDLLRCGAPVSVTACPSVPRQVSHFQFFFSIGQSF